MTEPRRYLLRMIAFVVVVLAVVTFLLADLASAFRSNTGLNGLIVGVTLLGVGYAFRQVLLLTREVRWIEDFRTGRPALSEHAAPRLLAPMATMLRDRPERLSLSAPAMRSLLDGISARLDEQRDIARYLIGLLISLGLVGTFWGLLQAIGNVAQVISGLTVGTGDLTAVFADLKRGLDAPLSGMGTAFSASLFGLTGSLVLGFLELQASQAQNRFYNDLEDWLSGQTRLGSGLISAEGEHSVPAYVQALLEQTAESLENLRRTLDRSEDSRISANSGIVHLTERLSTLTDQMRTEQALMMRLAENQLELKPILARLAEAPVGGVGAGAAMGDDTMRSHVRNLDLQMARLLEELSSGRSEIVQELRAEIRVLSRTIAAAAAERATERSRVGGP
jgi:hypothetical protein